MRFRLLTEGTKYDKKAIAKLVNSGLFDEEVSTKIVNGLFREDIHAFNHAPAWLEKYLVGIINMLIKHCDGDRAKASAFLGNSIDTFDRYLTWIKATRPSMPPNKQAELDKEFIEEMSYQDLEKKLDKIYAEMDEKSREELSKMGFGRPSNYELIPINSFSEFNSKFGGRATGDGSSDAYAGGGGTAWCHANSEYTYNAWVKGHKKFFVLANKNWKNIPFDRVSNKENPKDDYGNSLIAILVSERTGGLLRATLRCNHVGVESNADNQYNTYAELSKVAGFDVQKKVKDTLPEYEEKPNTFDGSKESLNIYLDNNGISREELTEFVIPSGVTHIGMCAFERCTSLTSITIPDSVTSIDKFAFCECKRLTSVKIPNSVTSIGDDAFEDCHSLTSITIPNGVTSIGAFVFWCCNDLVSITIPDSVTSIGEHAFSRCRSLISITIPDSVTTIGDDAFRACRNLTSIMIPDSVTSIGDGAFSRCGSLTSVTIGNGVTSIGDGAFKNCTSLMSIAIPDSVTSIGYLAFSGCDSLASVTIPNSVTSIGDSAFYSCGDLTSITIPDSVTSIGDHAFYGCDGLTIKCKKDSYADEYASVYDIPVEYI